MSEIREFFRHCPSCGRRFHIRLVSKQKVSEEEVTDYLPPRQADAPQSGLKFASRAVERDTDTPLEEGKPIYVDVTEFNYNYKCTHCGHQWTEVHEKDKTSKE